MDERIQPDETKGAQGVSAIPLGATAPGRVKGSPADRYTVSAYDCRETTNLTMSDVNTFVKEAIDTARKHAFFAPKTY
jgi:hypothetical protein